MAIVNFTVTPSNAAAAYWIAVDDQDVQLNNGVGSTQPDDSNAHYLVWWMKGNPGDTISIEGKLGAKTVVTVKQSTAGEKGTVAGTKKFQLQGGS